MCQADLHGAVGAVLKGDNDRDLAAGPSGGETVDERGRMIQRVLDQVVG